MKRHALTMFATVAGMLVLAPASALAQSAPPSRFTVDMSSKTVAEVEGAAAIAQPRNLILVAWTTNSAFQAVVCDAAASLVKEGIPAICVIGPPVPKKGPAYSIYADGQSVYGPARSLAFFSSSTHFANMARLTYKCTFPATTVTVRMRDWKIDPVTKDKCIWP
ncbi:hypothetical protein [Sphingomonas sp.]|uniref:hypothetical protein n=1 Tax=Sphingomonas sp. TaxID=28214 RepID=UPI001EBDD639|nr:hypothetical protein [Sphingomonas sp.]MBX3593788.1 hypothetical protein [Sphingomonas sp.]